MEKSETEKTHHEMTRTRDILAQEHEDMIVFSVWPLSGRFKTNQSAHMLL